MSSLWQILKNSTIKYELWLMYNILSDDKPYNYSGLSNYPHIYKWCLHIYTHIYICVFISTYVHNLLVKTELYDNHEIMYIKWNNDTLSHLMTHIVSSS